MRSDALYKYIRGGLKMLFLIAGCVTAGAYLHKCQSAESSGVQDSCVADTATYIDTIPYYEPKPKQEVSLGTKIVYVPVFTPGDKPAEAGRDSTDCAGGITVRMTALHDSVAVEIPITQKEYEGEDYHAWVSGYEAKMDSIYVFPRHETVTIREQSHRFKRWGIGVYAGYGLGPKGMQPSVGISVNYNLFSF